MSGELGKASLELGADMGGLRRDMNQARGLIDSSLSSLKGLAITYLSFQGLKATLGAAWSEAGKAAEAVAQLEARLRSTGNVAGQSVKGLEEFADQLQRTTTFENDAILAMQGILLSFTNIRGDTVKGATTAILDLSAAMGQDLRASVIQVGKALQEPIEGVTALRRVGVQLSDEQERQIKHFMGINDLASAQAVILGEMNREFGGTAKALRETPWGEATALAHTFGNTLEGIGKTIGELLHPALKALTNDLERFNAGGESWIEKIGKFTTVGMLLKASGALKDIVASTKALASANMQPDLTPQKFKGGNTAAEDILETLPAPFAKKKPDTQFSWISKPPFLGLDPSATLSGQSRIIDARNQMIKAGEEMRRKSEEQAQAVQDAWIQVAFQPISAGMSVLVDDMLDQWDAASSTFERMLKAMTASILNMIAQTMAKWAAVNLLGIFTGGGGMGLLDIAKGVLGIPDPSGAPGTSSLPSRSQPGGSIVVNVGSQTVQSVIRRLDAFDDRRGLGFGTT